MMSIWRWSGVDHRPDRPQRAGKTTVFNCLTGFIGRRGQYRAVAREKVTDVIQVLGQKLHPDDFLHPAQLGGGSITRCSVAPIW